NQKNLKNNSLKYLAEGLYHKNIATFRYDKGFFKQVLDGTFDEREVDFNDFIKDAINVVDYFKEDQRFSELIIIGHSQGSLVGMIAAQEKSVSKFISLAGAGQEIDDVVIDQLKKQSPALVENARKSFDDIRVNGLAQNYSPFLAAIFRPSLQPFMISWMNYNPQIEIAKLTIPVLIINGNNDLQVQVSEAEKLKNAKPDAVLVIIPNMNHLFKEIKGGLIENQKSYNDEGLPIMKKLIKTIKLFILK
ncbi:MAG: alpha/beta fold hydrolase, partial [Flavobacteriaceae bacterium]|nr:alpha/beta fold hydrolase [Flavobacteriaceae bacterium]